MVVAGLQSGSNYCNVTQLVDLSSSPKPCHDLKDYPLSMDYGAGAFVFGSPMICGGACENHTYHSECFKYNKSSDDWKWLASMKSNRSYSASVAINQTLFVTGGIGNPNKNVFPTTR